MRSAGNGCLTFWVLGALFAAMLTGLGSRGGSSARDEAYNQAAENSRRLMNGGDENSSADDSDSDVIVLERSGDGHFYADAEINGQSIRMLVDTGASAIALSRDDAQRAGIGVSIGMPEVVGQGASGDVHGEVVTIDRVALGDKEAESVTAVVLDGGETSLLGQSFLSKFDSVEITGDVMVLR
ncbi:MAG TPA: TIGR02281 family clan AA aspartic protease [Sphingomicrobium sp.]